MVKSGHRTSPWRLNRWLSGVAGILLLAGGSWYLARPSRADLEKNAIEAISRGDFARAEAALVRIQGSDPDVLRLLADVTYAQGRKQASLKWLEKWAGVSEQPATAFCEAGARAFEIGRPVEAERLFRRSIEKSPPHRESYQRLARLYTAWQRGQDLRAIVAEADRASVSLIEDPTLLWFWIVGDRIDWYEDESQTWLKSVLSESPDEPYALSALLRQSSQTQQTAFKLLGTPPEKWNRAWPWPIGLALANIEWDAGRINPSLAILDKFPPEADRLAETWAFRAKVAEASGDHESALRALEYACQLDPLYVAPLYHRGQLLSKQGDAATSESVLKRAIQLDELVRKSVRLLQSNQLNSDELISIAALGLDLGQDRWAQLVCQVIRRHDAKVVLPGPLESLVSRTVAPLSLPTPGSSPKRSPASSPSGQNQISTKASSPTNLQNPGTMKSITFTDTTADLSLDFRYEYGHTRERWLMETLGGGVAVIDYDQDGWPDLFFAQGGALSSAPIPSPTRGQLCRNQRGRKLSDVTTSASAIVTAYSHGCAVGDVNNDGFPDLLVCHYGGMSLLINQGDGTWEQPAAVAGAGATSDAADVRSRPWNTSAAFLDLNADGALDIYIAGYCHAPLSEHLRTCKDDGKLTPCRPSSYPAEADQLLINNREGGFSDQSKSCGINDDTGYGLGVIAADFDRDGVAEVFVGNDTTQNFLWQRTPPSDQSAAPHFHDIGLLSGVAVDGNGRAEACMGIACGDVDGDERLDLFVTNFFDETCTFYRNLGDLQFEDQTQSVGLSNAGRQLMGWGCQFLDADNDGWLDLAILNGHLHDMPQLPQFYHNEGGHFADRTTTAGTYFGQPRIGRSMATWDYNRDGKLDLVTSHQVEPASVLRNDSQTGKLLTVTLIGVNSVRDATGCIVTARVGDRRIVRAVSTQGGYLSACTNLITIGVGERNTVDELKIEWPAGTSQLFRHLTAGQHFLIREGNETAIPLPSPENPH